MMFLIYEVSRLDNISAICIQTCRPGKMASSFVSTDTCTVVYFCTSTCTSTVVYLYLLYFSTSKSTVDKYCYFFKDRLVRQVSVPLLIQLACTSTPYCTVAASGLRFITS